MAWEVELTADVQKWYRSLDPKSADRFTGTLDRLRERGPNLGRPFADVIKGSRYNNMKELRVSEDGDLRGD